jgi:hypothetical protein
VSRAFAILQGTNDKEQTMKFLTRVEPPEPMRGLEVPQELVEALGGGKRPAVTITINGHSCRSRVTIMRHAIVIATERRQGQPRPFGDETAERARHPARR